LDDILKPLSEVDDFTKLSRVKAMRMQSYYFEMDWLKNAQQACAFKAGDQWSESEKAALKATDREPMVWNYVHAMVELIVGILTQNGIDIRFQPVDSTDGFLCEVLGKLVAWVEDNQTDARILDAEAFESSITTGKGFRMVDFQPRPENPTEILFIEEAVPFWQVKVDPGSRKQDLSDARWVIVEKWVTLEDFKIRYPEHSDKIADIFFAHTQGAYTNQTGYDFLDPTSTAFDDYSDGFVDFYDYENMRVLVCHVEYFENYMRYYWVDKQSPEKTTEISPEQAKDFPKNEILKVPGKKVKWIHFTHDYILYDGDSQAYPDGFSIVPMYAYQDNSKRHAQYYGIVKLLIDPQRECNRRWMQSIRMMANQGVGLIGEAAAFVDLDQAQESWSNPDEITLLNEGGLGKIKERTAIQFPAASVQMQEISRESMKQISGMNADLMGFKDKEEPGIVLKLRQQQGMTIVSRLFENYKRMRNYLAKRKTYLITAYMPDWQIQKILGENDRFDVKNGHIIDKENGLVAPIRAIRDLKYNIKYEESPGNMTKTMAELAVFLDMVAKGFPVDPVAVIDRLDIDESAKTRWKKYIEGNNQMQQQIAQMKIMMDQQTAQAKVQADQAKIEIENTRLNGELALKNKEIEYNKAQADADRQAKVQIADEDRKVDIAGLEIDRDKNKENIRINKAKTVSEIQNKRLPPPGNGRPKRKVNVWQQI